MINKLLESKIFKTNLLILFVNLAFVLLSKKINAINSEFGFIFYQLVFILTPGLVYLWYSRYNIKEAISSSQISLEMILYSITIVILGYPIINISSYILNRETFLIDDSITSNFIITSTLVTFILLVLMYAVLPAICEEFAFRGVLNKIYKNYSFTTRVIIISLIFAFMHYDTKNFIGPFLLSVLLLYLYSRSGSLIPAIIGHFVYNLLGLIVVYTFYNLSSGNFMFIPTLDLKILSVLIVLISILLIYPIYKIIDIIESKYRLKEKLKESRSEVIGQISILEYYGKKITYSTYADMFKDVLYFSPIIVLFILYVMVAK